jgi:hypothetical protein
MMSEPYLPARPDSRTSSLILSYTPDGGKVLHVIFIHYLTSR